MKTVRYVLIWCMILAPAAVAAAAEKYQLHTFDKVQLSDRFFCEGASFGDFNNDGVMDIVSGPFWYAGPTFKQRHEYYEPKPYDINGYSKNFFAYSYDINKDGWKDIVIIGFPGEEAYWYENPQGREEHWKQHLILKETSNESPDFVDITGDGMPELICDSGGHIGYAEIPKDDPTKPWSFHDITPDRKYQRFTHGLGYGDLNGDGRIDILQKEGWWEQPADSKSEDWTFHPVKFTDAGGAQMLVFDVDGDGDNDVVTSKAAHGYGLSWFENQGRDADGGIKFKEHSVMGEMPSQNEFGVAFSELHALALADIDHDGIPDIVTGKRWWSHSEHSPGALEPAVVYWFKTSREDGKVRFIPHQIDADSGVGTQVVVGDINGDKWDDIVVGNKKGTFVLTHKVEDVDKQTYDAAQPKSVRTSDKPAAAAPPAAVAPVAKTGAPAEPADGFAAVGADGHELNFDFETGDLRDWAATGTAFQGQPIEGDTVHPRRSDSISGHHGKFWIGTYERKGDAPQGELTSVPFKVTHPYATFLIGGGAGNAMRVELVRADNNQVVFTVSGRAAEEMKPALADLHKQIGQEIFIRLVDHGSAGWGHINFDNFRLFDAPPAVVAKTNQAATGDDYPYAGLPPEEAVKVMKLPDGFKVKLAAGEPDVKQPIAMALDDRGRLWIAEAYTYPVRAPEGKGTDRILIFEDTDGDGVFDKRKVFAENLNLASGLEVGFGGVFVGAAPYLLFIPDRNGDDIPDGPPEVLLDGWGYQDTHETLNAFIWGPDGWLYGCHGVFTHSNVGKPGTPASERTPLTAGIWRYHPITKKFEVFAEGTSNPWGVDFDDDGQAFCTACVIPHLYHMIQGGRYIRQGGPHEEPYTYDDIKTIADHLHYAGTNGPHAGNGKSGDSGGGHAHAGAMIYLGGAWPDQYRSTIFMNNIHGQRINTDILAREGSGFVGHHGKDFLLSFDLASQILNLRYGPQGQVYVIDWYDLNACHHTNVEGHDRTNGRIYTVTYENPPAHKDVDLKKLSDAELAGLVLEKNDWYVRHSRRILEERAAAGKLDPAVRKQMIEIATTNKDETRRLRAMWVLDVTGGVPGEIVQKLLADENEYVRSWAIQLALDHGNEHLAELLPQFASMAKSDASPVVRLYLASAMQRVPVSDRWETMQALAAHAEDVKDHNLPLMYWYAAEPLAKADPERAFAFGLACGKMIPQLREFMLRRIGELKQASGIPVLVDGLKKSTDVQEQLAILSGLRKSLSGERRAKAPAQWADTYAMLSKSNNPELVSQARALGVTFGDEAAMQAMRSIASSNDAKVEQRREAIKALLSAKDPKLAATLQALIANPDLRSAALAGLGLYDDPQTPGKVLADYSQFSPDDKRTALATLCSRVPYGTAMLQAMADNKLPVKDLPADLVRQLQNLNDKGIDKSIEELWGQVRSTPADKAKLIELYRKLLAEAPPDTADRQLGRAVFAKTCQQCHTLWDVGGKVGPDLTGSNRSDPEYLLSNIVDPSAVIAKEYRPAVVVTTDGRVITGILIDKNDKSITLRTATETIVQPLGEIERQSLSEISMMPDNQLTQFSNPEIASLFAYLRGKNQSPLLATKENAANFFNGKDLTGWTGDKSLWSVENGEIVGRTAGLKHNTFLMSDITGKDFKLSLEVKLVDDAGNSGVQFRSEPLDGYNEFRGYQADIGPGWWGKLYEENARGLLTEESGEKYLKKGEWNKYEVEAIGGHIRTWLNGNLCVDYEDKAGARQGVFALQLHSGDKTEVRYRNIELDVK